MQSGIGLPATIPGVQGDLLFDWARQAEAGPGNSGTSPFSSLAILDRLVYPNYEPLITLAAVAGVTQRVRLVTTVLLATLRNTAMLAKQAASLDALSGGRLTLGLGIGAREDDFRAAGVSIHERGKRFDEQLRIMKRIWSGEPLSDTIGAIGPRPARQGGPELLIGGYSPTAMKRVGPWGDGYISGGGGPAQASQLYKLAEESWKAAGKPGKPRLVTCMYYGLGPNAEEGIGATIRHYYSFMGPMVEQRVKSIASSPEAVKAAIASFADIGVDELMFWPCIPRLDQIDRLVQVIG